MALLRNLFFILACLSYGVVAAENVEPAFDCQQIPENDRRQLTDWFRYLVASNHFGYTLFADKPIAYEAYCTCGLAQGSFAPGYPVECGWNVWQAYSHLFNSDHFLFVENEQYPECNIRALYLINIRAFIDVVSAHLPLFRSILGEETTPEKMLSEVVEGKSLLNDVLKGRRGLEGIIYGYGLNSPLLYQRREEIESFLLDSGSAPFLKPAPSEGFESLEEEDAWLWERLGSNRPGAPLRSVTGLQMAMIAFKPSFVSSLTSQIF